MQITSNSYDRFFPTSAIMPQSSQVLYLQVWSQSWPCNSLHRMLVKFNLKMLRYNLEKLIHKWGKSAKGLPISPIWKDVITQSFIARNWVIKYLGSNKKKHYKKKNFMLNVQWDYHLGTKTKKNMVIVLLFSLSPMANCLCECGGKS